MLLKWKIKIKRKWNLEWEIFFLLSNALTFFNEKKEGFFFKKFTKTKKKIKEIIFKNKTVQLEIDPINNKLQ